MPRATPHNPAGDLLRRWRAERGLTQLDLSLRTGISTRHLSFIETGKARPSRELLLRVGEELELSSNERSRLLLSAGLAPELERSSHGAFDPATRALLRRVLDGHAPHPALVVDRSWQVLESNACVGVLLEGVAPELLEPPANSLRIALHPRGMAPRIQNLGEWREHLLARLQRQAEATGSPSLRALHDELRAYPGGRDAGPSEDARIIPLKLERAGETLTFLTTIATFGTPLDAALEELIIEAFYPADELTARALAHWHATVDPTLVEDLLRRTRGEPQLRTGPGASDSL